MPDSDFEDDSFLAEFDLDAAIAKRNNDVGKINPPFDSNSNRSIGNKVSPNEFSSMNPFRGSTNENDDKKGELKSASKILCNPYQKRPLTTDTNPSFPKRFVANQRTISAHVTQEISASEKQSLEQTLNKYFGHRTFRPGQLEIVHTLLQKRDAAVFWSTGSGKSLCYQIPPLHSGKIALIISPLISLMEDQVAKINGIVPSDGGGEVEKKDIAVFLGSGQRDRLAEQKAVNGKYQLIYCTPEKLVSGEGWFLTKMGELHTRTAGKDGLCLIAVDESHCVSEWGHDFRPQYRKIGDALKGHNILKTVPIVALTATAVPRVQSDIISSLHLRNPNIVKQSFDRENLVISVKRKPAGGYRTALKTLVGEMKERNKSKSSSRSSTIIYCPTQSQVEEVSHWLGKELEGSGTRVQSYHGGQGIEHRSDAHINFLTGKTSIIVATLAFGMGIDKTDTRRIIHYGPPKTVEEYYQQIGRAGRDGIEAHCVMFCNSCDFDRYKNDFYLGGLGPDARSSQEMSIESLKRYALSDEVCRRAELLKFFNEDPSFGERCGTCDTCVSRAKHSDDIERDFAKNGARLLLYVISILNGKQGIGNLEKILRGNKIESYRYQTSYINHDLVRDKVIKMKSQMTGYKKRVAVTYFTKDLLPALVSRGFVNAQSHSATHHGRTTTWSGYRLTSAGNLVLHSGQIVLPVPATVREYEREQEEKIQKCLEDLKKVGVDVDQIPKHELEEGDGAVFKSLRTWYNYLDLLQRNEHTSRIDALEDLRLRIDAWRMDVAGKFRIAPAHVIPDHLILSVAYAAASIKHGHMEKDALLSVGVRSGGIDDLVTAINEWIDENKEDSNSGRQQAEPGCAMIFPCEHFKAKKEWEYFLYRRQKKTGLAAWESSYERFAAGEHPHAIAMAPLSGRPIQVNTVVGHIFDGMLSGRAVDLRRLSTYSTPPTKSEWDKLSRMEAETGISVSADPKTSGKNGEALRMTDVLGPIMGEEFLCKEYKDRTAEERANFSRWCNLFKWYSTLTRIGFSPTFGSKSKVDTSHVGV